MGAWGFGIRDDDFVRDVIGVFEDQLKAGHSVADATTAVKERFSGASEDSIDGSLFWLAVADVQWTYGGLEASVLERVQADFESGRSLLQWEEDPRGLARRRTALQKFIAKIGAENPRPKPPPKTIVREAKFQPGDCLSIQLPSGQYTAGIVLAADDSLPEQGRNLVAVLDYFSADPPTMDVFRNHRLASSRNGWITGPSIGWYLPIGFRTVKNRLAVVGQVEVLASDPKDSNFYFRWTTIGQRVK